MYLSILSFLTFSYTKYVPQDNFHFIYCQVAVILLCKAKVLPYQIASIIMNYDCVCYRDKHSDCSNVCYHTV